MKVALKIFILTVLATAFYAYVGHMVPQKITYPPEEVQLTADMTTAELVKVGEEIVGGKGTCLSCHTIGAGEGGRFPDLGGIGARAAGRVDGYSDVDYLAESLYEPNVYIVEGFNPGMPAANKPPIGLSDLEIIAVIAYLQSLGGTPSVSAATNLKYASGAPAAATASTTPAAGTAAAAEPVDASGLDPEGLMTTYLCITCHKLDTPDPLVGPSLYDVGARLSPAELYESIMEPDKKIAEGFPGGVMGITLQGAAFYEKVTAAQLKAIVDYLAERKGGQ